ncbi:dTDP-glucose 4,6-dehydratase [Candidatus Woesearchaeota archaeon]|nr:dTDP-glucose 4,6-dehydratase [Candidatus Woesearchaeota archaeon]
MKLLITGGAGFIGSNFVQYWSKKHSEDKIVILDKLTYAGNLENLKKVEKNKNYSFIQGDICNKEDVEKAMTGVDVVIHFAAETHVDRSLYSQGLFAKTNVIGTHVLLEEAIKNKTRFHHISTDEVFGSLPKYSGEKFNEETTYNPKNPYSQSKAQSDYLVKLYHQEHDLPITISNCSNNYGPYQYPEKLIPLAITHAIKGKKIPVYGNGLYFRDWLYVEDHCKAIEVILKKGKIGESYCVGGLEKDVNNIEIVFKILDFLDKDHSHYEHVADRPNHDKRYSVDWSKLKKLGWKPESDLETYLEKTIKWYVDNQKWWEKLLKKK